jgi:energy-coupling factor transporter ATP-binding protein EcfA2
MIDSWGISLAGSLLLKPVLEKLAVDVVEDTAKSYVGKVFANVFSVIHKSSLRKATGLAIYELLALIENELLDADEEEEFIRGLIPQVQCLLEDQLVCSCFEPLFLDPDYHLDPQVFAKAWQQPEMPTLPEEFSWQRIAKRFSRKVKEIRNSGEHDFKETFDSLLRNRDSDKLQDIAGLPVDFDLDRYREALVERFSRLNFDSLDTSGANYDGIQLWSVFVPQSVRECHAYRPQLLEIPKEHQHHLLEKGEIDAKELQKLEEEQEQLRRAYFEQPIQPVLEVLNDPGLPCCVVLGDPGSGKSTLLRSFALAWARIEDSSERVLQPLPLLIELRDYNRWECNSGKSFPRYLHEGAGWHRLNQHTLDYYLQNPGRVVLLLDGLDEVFDPLEREQVINDIFRFSNEYPDTRIIVTSRVVGYKGECLRDAGFSTFMLQDLDQQQIDDFLHRWHAVTMRNEQDAEHKRERLARGINSAKSIRMLAGNPLLLTMMAIINRYQELPRDRVLLYEKAAELLLMQWDTERHLAEFPGLSNEIDLRAKTDILRKVAYQMQNGIRGDKAANIIDGASLTKIIETYLREELHFQQARAAANALVQHLRTRNFILCDLGGDNYAFVHRTFLEYFCAAEYVNQFEKEKVISEDELIALFDNNYQEDDWHEVLRLICNQVDPSFAEKIIRSLMTKSDIESWNKWSALPNIVLAIWCLGDQRKLSGLDQIGAELLTFATRCFLEGNQVQESFIKQLIDAAQSIGQKWPGKSSFEYRKQYPLSEPFFHHIGWPHFLGAVFEERDWFEGLSQCGSWDVRRGANQVLAEKWPDESTREFLLQRAVQDESPTPRRTALECLFKQWPDESTREFLLQRAVQDEEGQPRSTALECLVKQWPDESTREFLLQRAVQDEAWQPRRTALECLVKQWPDESTREFLLQRAVQDDDNDVRRTALECLFKQWPDESTREFLLQRAVQDESPTPRRTALECLVKQWPDVSTREFLLQRAVQDESPTPRRTALECLFKQWPCEAIERFIQERAFADGVAASMHGGKHSRLGKIIFTRDLDGIQPYIDPTQPIDDAHLNEAAKKCGIAVEELEATIQSLSEHMGWDVRKGSAAGKFLD